MADEEAVGPAMRGELLSRGSDRQIATLATDQEGVVTRVQLLALGLSSSAIDRRLAGGRLHLLHRGVYAVGHPCLPPLGRLMAAVLATGATAVASHRSAAALHGIRAYDGWPEVTGLPGARARPPHPHPHPLEALAVTTRRDHGRARDPADDCCSDARRPRRGDRRRRRRQGSSPGRVPRVVRSRRGLPRAGAVPAAAWNCATEEGGRGGCRLRGTYP